MRDRAFGKTGRRCDEGGLWRVLIAEHDPEIASVYGRTILTTPRMAVAGTVSRGEDALAFVQHRGCDLLLLDLRLPGMSGLRLLRNIRASGGEIDVIALTATRNRTIVSEVIRYGVVDYLVKPFTVERLRRALALFVNRADALQADLLDQAAIDVACASGRVDPDWLPKGLSSEGVELVRRTLARGGTPQSAIDVANAAGLARGTARRYLEYLVSIGEATVAAPPRGPGRPRKLYRSASGVVPRVQSVSAAQLRVPALRTTRSPPGAPGVARPGAAEVSVT